MRQTGSHMGFRGALAIFFSAAVWGIFWIPMRYFDQSGLTALWAVVAINFAASLIAIPVAYFKGEFTAKNFKWLLAIGIGMGLSNVLYFAGLILSDVIRVTFLFYLLPIWATIFSKLIFNVTIGPLRAGAVMLAACGIWLLLGGGSWPVPKNLGDVFALFSGTGWALGLTLIRGRENLGGFGTAAMSHFFSFIGAVVLGIILMFSVPDVQPPPPSLEIIAGMALPVAVFAMVIMWPTNVGQLWGAQYVAATTAALLTMSEIVVATLSTTLLESTELTIVSWVGGGLIILAIFADLRAGQDA